MRRSIRYIRQACRVMSCKLAISGPILAQERMVMEVQRLTLGLVGAFALSGRQTRVPIGLRDASGRVRVQIEMAGRSEVICSAIQVSTDNGRTYFDPLQPNAPVK